MSIANELQQQALVLANEKQRTVLDLEKKKADMEMKLHQIEAQLDMARLSHKRFPDYRPEIGTDYQCPRCWINNERRSTLVPIPSDNDTDTLRCRNCGIDFHIRP